MGKTKVLPSDTLLFTRGRNWWSRLICKVLNEPVSHVAVLREGWVYHSDLLGVRREEYDTFAARQAKIYRKPVSRMRSLEANYAKHRHSWYDLGAFAFLGLSFVARRYFKVPLPKSNLWQSSGMFICTEWATKNGGTEDSMITPWGLYLAR